MPNYPLFKVGDRVFHRGSKERGTVVEVKPTGYGVEYRIAKDGRGEQNRLDPPSWWFSGYVSPESEHPWPLPPKVEGEAGA